MLIDSYVSGPRPPHSLTFDNLNVSSLEELVQLFNPDSDLGASAADRLRRFVEYRVHVQLLLYVPPIFFVVGLVGNLLSAVILTRPPMRSISTYRYLAVLSFTDSLVLCVGLLRMWLGQLLIGNDVLDQWTWACKLVNVVGYTVSNFSVWLIVAVTAERFVAVCYPLMAPSVCSRRRATRIILGVLAVQLVVHVHFAWTVGVRATDKATALQPVAEVRTQCVASPGFETLVDEVWPWLDAAIYSFVPFVVIMALNSMMMRQVVASKRSRGQLCQQQTSRQLTRRPDS